MRKARKKAPCKTCHGLKEYRIPGGEPGYMPCPYCDLKARKAMLARRRRLLNRRAIQST